MADNIQPNSGREGALVLIKDAPRKPFEAARHDAAERATLILASNMLETAGPAMARAQKLVAAAIGAVPKDRLQPKAEAASVLDRLIEDLQSIVAELRP